MSLDLKAISPFSNYFYYIAEKNISNDKNIREFYPVKLKVWTIIDPVNVLHTDPVTTIRIY